MGTKADDKAAAAEAKQDAKDEKAAAAANAEAAKQDPDPNGPAGPEGPEGDPGAAQGKQGVITPDDMRRAGPKRLKVPGFKGTFKDASFNDDGESEGPVSEETAAAIKAQFPGVKIETIE